MINKVFFHYSCNTIISFHTYTTIGEFTKPFICSTLIQIISSHTNTKRDTSSEIDPYAAYYEYYANQQAAIEGLPDAIPSNEIYEKQGVMQDVFGSEAGVR